MKKIPIIMDVDTGIDDAVALVLALQAEKLDVRGVTVVAGNQTLDKTLYNTLSVVEYLGRSDVPVAKGASTPLARAQLIAEETHGESGLGSARLPKPTITPHTLDAVSFMREAIENSSEKITLVPVGPLTNIALLLMAYPHVKDNIKEIVMMGGGAYEGNCNATSEFNILVDPEAAAVVFSSGVNIVMCGLDITMKSYATKEDIQRIKDTKTIAGEFCAEAFLVYYNRYINSATIPGCAVHDAVAVTYLLHPEYITGEYAHVNVDIDGRDTYAATACDFRPWRDKGKDNTFVCTDIKREKFIDLLVDACKSYKGGI